MMFCGAYHNAKTVIAVGWCDVGRNFGFTVVLLPVLEDSTRSVLIRKAAGVEKRFQRTEQKSGCQIKHGRNS